MSLLRPLFILLIFFGTTYYFREPLKQVAGTFESLHSAYAEPFKQLFKEITSASSSTVLGGLGNFIPSYSSTTTSFQPQSNMIVTKANSTQATTLTAAQNKSTTQQGMDLSPVISNQQEGTLSILGIVSYTNSERAKRSLPSLKIDKELTASAETKLQDMFQNQYFEHISPSGASVSDLVTKAGYQYIVVGENLALGLFAGDDQVVAAWMASPGHKRNILDVRYQDIGVAVGYGMYQGRKQWLIVQHFGKPLSSCMLPSDATKKNIEDEKNIVAGMEQQISTLKAQIDQSTGDEYRQKAIEYNTLVESYNTELAKLKADIDSYNLAVKNFNICAGITG